MIYEYLDNGVEVALKENHFTKSISIQCWVHAGSLHETDKEHGIAHLIEHMLFKGTDKRDVGELGRTVEASGGNVNAYTTFDRTVYYLTMLSKHARLGVDLLSDAIFNSTFNEDELAREKEVVLEEIKRGMDNPNVKLGRKVFASCYKGSGAARPVIGYSKSVSGFTRKNLQAFHKKWYQPKNMSVVIVGDFNSGEMMKLVKEFFGSYKSPKIEKITQPKHTFPTKPQVSLFKDDYKIPKLEIVLPAPVLEHGDTPALDIASFVLGSGDTSRLHKKLIKEKGIALSTNASTYTPSDFPGIFSLSAYATEDNYLETVRNLAEELINVVHLQPVTQKEAERARVNLKSDRIYQEETVSGQARSIGFGLNTTHKFLYEDVYSQLIDTTPPSIIEGALKRWIHPQKAVIVGMLPNGSKLTEGEVEKAYNEGLALGLAKKDALKIEHPSLKEEDDIIAPQVLELMPGVKFIYQQNPAGKLFSLCAVTEGGLRAESDEDSGIQNAVGRLLAESYEGTTHDKLVDRIESLGATLEGFAGKDSLGINLQCMTPDTKELIELFAKCLLKPVFPKDLWDIRRKELQETFAAQNDSPSGICMRLFQEKIFADHPYRYPSYGTEESTKRFTAEALEDYFKKYRDAGEWVISCVGPEPKDKVFNLLKSSLSSWGLRNETRTFNSKEKIPKETPVETVTFKKQREQTHIVFGFKGLTWYDKDRPALDVLINILGGHGGRLFMNLREKKSLAYSVSPIASYGCHPGLIGSYIACSPSKKDEALTAMRREFNTLCEELVTDDELHRSINYIVGNHEMGLQKTDSKAMTMSLMELYKIGFDDYKKYPQAIEKVTKEDVQHVARKLFAKEGLTVIVGSEI